MNAASSIKKTIEFNKGFRGLLEVIKLLAVSQYYALEKKIQTFERLEHVFGEFFQSMDLSGTRHPFLDPQDRPIGVIAVSSDAGLLGGLNMQVITQAADLTGQGQRPGSLVVVGERGQTYAKEMGIPFEFFPLGADEERYPLACQLCDYISAQVIQGKMGSVKVVYPRSTSLVMQRIEVATLLPFSISASPLAPSPADVPPMGETFARGQDILWESSLDDLLEYLVHLFLGQRLAELLSLSRLAEHAARFVHLDECGRKITEINQKLLLQYFRRRHELIDQNMRELFAARNIYAGQAA